MSVRSVLRPMDRDGAASAGWGVAAAPGMSQLDAAAALAISAAVVALALSDPENALYSLLAVPIWIVSRDLGLLAGAAAGACALLFGVILAAERELGLIEQLDRAAVFTGAVAAGALARPPNRDKNATRRTPLPCRCRTRPQRVSDATGDGRASPRRDTSRACSERMCSCRRGAAARFL